MCAFCIANDTNFLRADNEDCADAQANLSLPWAQLSDGTFSHDVGHMLLEDFCSRSVHGSNSSLYIICWFILFTFFFFFFFF